jgi:hypothetical protein
MFHRIAAAGARSAVLIEEHSGVGEKHRDAVSPRWKEALGRGTHLICLL